MISGVFSPDSTSEQMVSSGMNCPWGWGHRCDLNKHTHSKTYSVDSTKQPFSTIVNGRQQKVCASCFQFLVNVSTGKKDAIEMLVCM